MVQQDKAYLEQVAAAVTETQSILKDVETAADELSGQSSIVYENSVNAESFDVLDEYEMNCMEYRYTMDTPVSCRITDKAAMQTIFDALCEVKIGERTDMRATDSEQSLTFVKTDGTTCVIRFEQRNLLHEEDAYQLENDAALWKALREAK